MYLRQECLNLSISYFYKSFVLDCINSKISFISFIIRLNLNKKLINLLVLFKFINLLVLFK